MKYFFKQTATSYKLPATGYSRGVSLIDSIVGIALMTLVFVGIVGVFRLSVDVVTNNKARSGAIALANQRMEYIRSLTYAALGTSGGIPSGALAQTETLALNGVTYTRRTLIEYVDDPKDGLGAADQNSLQEDYKIVKVDVAWTYRTGTRHVTLVTRVTPAAGLETDPCSGPCGILSISVVNASSTPLSGASVTITNPSTTPTVSISTFTNASGTVTIGGAPAAAGYRITATQTNYSSSQTYTATAQNTNPNPANLTVANNLTTTGTFGIDLFSSKTIRTWNQIQNGTWTDTFADSSKIGTSTNITVSAGTAKLVTGQTTGVVHSVNIVPTNLNAWVSLVLTHSQPAGTSLRYRLYDGNSDTLIPDSELPGNSVGFTATTTIGLANLSTTTHPGLRLDAAFTGTVSATPSLDAWTVNYTYGPTALPNIAFTLQGAKTIGSGPSGTLYKYSTSQNSGAGASVSLSNLEWDTYTILVNGTTTGYDIASACRPQPELLYPGTSQQNDLYFLAHTVNSLLVDVRASSTGALLKNATVNLKRTTLYSSTSTTDYCGQTFFPSLTSASNYTLTVFATGYATSTTTNVNVAGTSKRSVGL